MENPNYYKLTKDILSRLSFAATKNAEELIEEAKILFENKHPARAYFLAVASIEESGKAQIAFSRQGRKIQDTSIAAKVKWELEDHPSKITSAFISWINSSKDMASDVKKIAGLMVMLKNGREPSMYTDIHIDGQGIHIPSEKVRLIAARDCIRLAIRCFETTKKEIEAGLPPMQTTKNQDLLYSMKTKDYQSIMRSENFWQYALNYMEKKKFVFEDIIIEYKANYYEKSAIFKPETKE